MTAMSTAKSGYIQRRIVKCCEDIQVQYDGTVRDATGKIYQLAYGETGWNASSTIRVDGEQQVCNISNIVTKLNMQYEVEKKKRKKRKKVKKKKVKINKKCVQIC